MIKVVICFLRCHLFAPLILLSSFNGAFSQSVIVRTQSGLMAIYSSDSLSFTLQLDEPLSEMPEWIDSNRLQLFKDIFYLTIIEPADIGFKKNNDKKINASDALQHFKTWETLYIDSILKKEFKKSDFIIDNNHFGGKLEKINFNAWYYYLTIDKQNIYFYFYDQYKSGMLLRFEFNGVLFKNDGLDAARNFINNCVKNTRFYSKPINLEVLIKALKSGAYSYDENKN
jgi:hypothetical protein